MDFSGHWAGLCALGIICVVGGLGVLGYLPRASEVLYPGLGPLAADHAHLRGGRVDLGDRVSGGGGFDGAGAGGLHLRCASALGLGYGAAIVTHLWWNAVLF